MPLIVKQVTAPASEPVTLAELKAQLRVTFTDEDSIIASMGVAARRFCEVLSKSTFVNTTFDMVDDSFPFTGGAANRTIRQFYSQFQGGGGIMFPGAIANNCGVITFPRAPLVSVTSITYLDVSGNTVALDPSNYVVTTGSPGRVGLKFGKIWPVTLPQVGAVTIRFVAGMGADASFVPEEVKAAIKLKAASLYMNRFGQVMTDVTPTLYDLLSPEAWGSYS